MRLVTLFQGAFDKRFLIYVWAPPQEIVLNFTILLYRRSPSVLIEHEKAENRRQPSFTGPDGNPHQVRRKAAGGHRPPNQLPSQVARKRNLRVHGTGRYGQPRRPRNGAERRERKRGGRHPPGKKAEAARPPRKKPHAGAKQQSYRIHFSDTHFNLIHSRTVCAPFLSS